MSFATLSTLFVIGSIPFWILTAAALIAILVAVENEKGFFATVSVGLYVGLLHLLGDANLIAWTREHWKLCATLAVAYLIAGTVWGVVKWAFYTRKLAHETEETYLNTKRNFLRSKGIVFENLTIEDPVPENLREAWRTYLRDDYSARQITMEPPQVSQHKARIMGWMMFWPVSLTWTLLNDPVRAAFQHIYASISSTLQEISNKAFNRYVKVKKLDLDIPPPPPVPATPASEVSKVETSVEAPRSSFLSEVLHRAGGGGLSRG